MVGVAALGSQLVTTRAAYAAAPSATDRTLVVIFLRGAADGLRILAPNSADLGRDYLRTVRADLVPGDADLIALPGTGGWGLSSALQPLYDGLWSTGELAFVPGVSSAGHQPQPLPGPAAPRARRLGHRDLRLARPGAHEPRPGHDVPRGVRGQRDARCRCPAARRRSRCPRSADFTFPGWDEIRPASQQAVLSLYRGLGGTLGEDVPNTIAALGTAAADPGAPAPIRRATRTATSPRR